jgi:nicotinamide-nucleotide adenylyltransferase
MKNTALYIGRFQPFHNGHLDAIQQIFAHDEVDFLIIGIGSAENDFSLRQPLTAGERFEMILNILNEAKIPSKKYAIAPIRDIHRYCLWTKHVKSMVPHFDYVFSGSRIVRHLFQEYEKDVKVINLEKRLKICATDIRDFMIQDNDKWQNLVPKSVTDFIKKIKAIDRLKVL